MKGGSGRGSLSPVRGFPVPASLLFVTYVQVMAEHHCPQVEVQAWNLKKALLNRENATFFTFLFPRVTDKKW